MTNYKCADCGGTIKQDQKFCGGCGSELVWGNTHSISFFDSIISSIIPFKEMSSDEKIRYEDRKWLANKMRWTGLNGIVSLAIAIGFFLLCIIFFAGIMD